MNDPSADTLVGAVVGGRFLIETPIGSGAMATVYRANHVKVGRRFAVKVMHRALLSSEKMRARFEREAASLAQVPGSSFYRRLRAKFGLLA